MTTQMLLTQYYALSHMSFWQQIQKTPYSLNH